MNEKAKNINASSGVTNNNTFNDQRNVNYYPNVITTHDPALAEELKNLKERLKNLEERYYPFESEMRKTVINLSSTQQKTHHKDRKDTGSSSHSEQDEWYKERVELITKSKKLEDSVSQLHVERQGWQKERLGLHNKIKQLEKNVCELKKEQSQSREHKQNDETPTDLSIVEILLRCKPELNIYKAHQLLLQPHQSKEEFTKKILEDADGRLVLSDDGKYLLKRKNNELGDKVDDNQNNGNKRQKHVR